MILKTCLLLISNRYYNYYCWVFHDFSFLSIAYGKTTLAIGETKHLVSLINYLQRKLSCWCGWVEHKTKTNFRFAENLKSDFVATRSIDFFLAYFLLLGLFWACKKIPYQLLVSKNPLTITINYFFCVFSFRGLGDGGRSFSRSLDADQSVRG